MALRSYLWILLGRQEGSIFVSGLGKVETGSDLHGARMDPRPEGASLLQDRS